MKHPFDLDDFESFLSEEAEQLRMYPDDRVWRNIQGSLHEKDRWPALTFGSILTGAVITVMLILVHPNKELLTLPNSFGVKAPTEKQVADNNSASIPEVLVTKQTSDKQYQNVPQPFGSLANVATATNDKVHLQVVVNNLNIQGENDAQPEMLLAENDLPIKEPALLHNADREEGISVKKKSIAILPVTIEDNHQDMTPTMAIGLSEEQVEEVTSETNIAIEQGFERNFIENTLNKKATFLPPPTSPKLAKWALQIYATPSISYRYLIDDKKMLHDPTNGPLAPHLTQDANAFVTQRPKMGLEVGAAVLYKIADNFRLKTGLQLNYRQFGISAFASNRQPATIELNRGTSTESITEFTNISNQDGYRPMELTSQFVQLALPIGFDLKIAEINKVEFYMAAAGQLTYQLASRNYLLSSDFKNYIKQSDFERKINVNTAIEAFATFEAGGVTWQAGPQIRYQLLPGSKDAYPIREHLIDYGMKIGIIKSIK